jgi:predicted CoA-binding protein
MPAAALCNTLPLFAGLLLRIELSRRGRGLFSFPGSGYPSADVSSPAIGRTFSMSPHTIAIVGASNDRRKFGNRAVRAYARRGWEVYPVNPHETTIEGRRVHRSVTDIPVSLLDRVSLYIPPDVGLRVLQEVARNPPRELWLNPGAESPDLIARAEELGLKVVVGCSIVDIGELPAI